jgi:hypothetical protein
VPIHFHPLDPFRAMLMLRVVWRLAVHDCGRTSSANFAI